MSAHRILTGGGASPATEFNVLGPAEDPWSGTCYLCGSDLAGECTDPEESGSYQNAAAMNAQGLERGVLYEVEISEYDGDPLPQPACVCAHRGCLFAGLRGLLEWF